VKSRKVQNAISLVVHYHRNQYREDGGGYLPSLAHFMGVATQLWEWGIANQDLIAEAICHDILEDTECPFRQLTEALGERSAAVVEELTFRPPSDGEKAQAKEQYLASFMGKSLNALVIKVADRVQNVRAFQCHRPDYATKYFNKAEPLFDALYARQKEIEAEFGLPVFEKICGSVSELL
jgi:(p)ppGpp synthase/HD superfamily hydrolase